LRARWVASAAHVGLDDLAHERGNDGELTTNDEVSEFRWATRDEVTGLVDEAFAVRVLDGLEANNMPAIRQHDGVHLLV
jgi:8-oxo-dGTP diphosphatase